MILHTVNKANAIDKCLDVVGEKDAVLLLEDGVYAVLDQSTWEALPESMQFFVLSDDLLARGLSNKKPARFNATSWQDFVALTTQYDKVVSWG